MEMNSTTLVRTAGAAGAPCAPHALWSSERHAACRPLRARAMRRAPGRAQQNQYSGCRTWKQGQAALPVCIPAPALHPPACGASRRGGGGAAQPLGHLSESRRRRRLGNRAGQKNTPGRPRQNPYKWVREAVRGRAIKSWLRTSAARPAGVQGQAEAAQAPPPPLRLTHVFSCAPTWRGRPPARAWRRPSKPAPHTRRCLSRHAGRSGI